MAGGNEMKNSYQTYKVMIFMRFEFWAVCLKECLKSSFINFSYIQFCIHESDLCKEQPLGSY